MSEKQGGYQVTDLPEGATPDPLGDKSLTPSERVGETAKQQDDDEQAGEQGGGSGGEQGNG
jgi:hypothetical protein